MANRSGQRRGLSAPQLEHEIERCRELEHWTKVEELAKKLKTSFDSSQFVTLSHFLTGEAKLEQYLIDNPPLRNSSTRKAIDDDSKNGLREAKSCLLSTIGDDAAQLGMKFRLCMVQFRDLPT